MADLQALSDEINNDPEGFGYGVMSPKQILETLYTVGLNGQALPVSSIETADVIEATVKSEYDSLSQADKDLYAMFVSAGTINPDGSNTKATFSALFGVGTQTRTNLLALAARPASRAEILGLFRRFREYDVIQAWALYSI